MKPPYLIQRCTINRPLVKGCVSDALTLDYMGSAEFEYGAPAKSLRAFQERVGRISFTVDQRIRDDQRSLRVLHTFDGAKFEEYFAYLLQMRSNGLQLKENSGFGQDAQCWSETDVWWDLENHVFWSFDKIFMHRLGDCLVASWKHMDQK